MNKEITKSYYEDISYVFLKRNLPAVIVVSGDGYRKFVKNFQKPYDPLFMKTMQSTLKYLCDSVPGCVFGYTEGFEFVLLLTPPSGIEETSWFTYDVQKIASLTASLATMKFNKLFEKNAKSYVMAGNNFDQTKKLTAMQGYVNAIDTGALFTAGCFNLPAHDIFRYLEAKQKSALNQAIGDMGETYFSAQELAGKTASEVQKMAFENRGINFEDYPNEFKRGSACLKMSAENGISDGLPQNASIWKIDREMPLLCEDTRSYIERLF